MKIAVLISGEYRKFDVTRKTMPFLDRPEIDVYVSTWDKTIYANPKLNLRAEVDVTEEMIKRELGRTVTSIKIDKHDLIKETRYNTKMIDRWLAGFKLIEDSGIKYDSVLVMRTDLFFNENFGVNLDRCISDYMDSIAFAWASSIDLKKLPDIIFMSSFKNIKLLFDSLKVKDWLAADQHDWHIWWYTYVSGILPNILNGTHFGSFYFCRYWVDHTHTYADIPNIAHDWRDLFLLHQCDMWGDKFVIGTWPDSVLINAKDKWNSGYFDKYKVT